MVLLVRLSTFENRFVGALFILLNLDSVCSAATEMSRCCLDVEDVFIRCIFHMKRYEIMASQIQTYLMFLLCCSLLKGHSGIFKHHIYMFH